jgi:hypothetical protein
MHTKEPKGPNLLAKSVLIGILAFSAGTGSVLAASEIKTTTPSSAPVSVSVTHNTASTSQAGTTLNESGTETPDNLPGDFFYFVKTIYENIQLALTINDVKEARLLTAFAQERLAEANAFSAQGKTEEAKLSLQKSLETQQSAVQKADQASGTSTTVATTQAKTTTLTEATTQAGASTQKAAATTAEQPGSEQTTAPEQSEAEDEITPVKEVKNPEQVLKVKADLQHNIVALTSALEKVENPKAQLALMKNIEKSFAHLDKKLSKIESKQKQGQTNENVTALEEQASVATPVPASVLEPVLNEPASVQVEQESSVAVKVETKKSEDKPEKNKSDKAKEGKNDNQRNGGGKGNGNGQDKDKEKEKEKEKEKGNKQE